MKEKRRTFWRPFPQLVCCVACRFSCVYPAFYEQTCSLSVIPLIPQWPFGVGCYRRRAVYKHFAPPLICQITSDSLCAFQRVISKQNRNLRRYVLSCTRLRSTKREIEKKNHVWGGFLYYKCLAAGVPEEKVIFRGGMGFSVNWVNKPDRLPFHLQHRGSLESEEQTLPFGCHLPDRSVFRLVS